MFAQPRPTAWDLKFNAFGIRTTISPWFWLLALLISPYLRLSGGVDFRLVFVWVLAVLVSILIHELGHALTGRKFGMFNQKIVLYHFGGVAMGDGRLSWGQHLLMILAGPAASFLLAGIAVAAQIGYMVATRNAPPESQNVLLMNFLNIMFIINLFWGILNMIPLYPLDGGQVSMALFTKYKPMNGARYALRLSVITGVVAALVTGVIWMFSIFNLLLFGMLAYSSWQMLQQMGGWSGNDWGGGGGFGRGGGRGGGWG